MNQHRDGWVAEQALQFLDKGIDPERPLFLSVLPEAARRIQCTSGV